MKNKRLFSIFLCLFVALACAQAASFKKGDTVYVSAKTGVLKDSSGNFGKDVAKVSYGDSLKVLSVSGKKVQVKLSDGSATGWISSGSLTKKKIVKTSSQTSVNANAKELALAGKGFSEESEGVYSASNSDLDFSAVDAIEALTVSESDMESFISEGHLLGGEK